MTNDFYDEFDKVTYSFESKALLFYAVMKIGRPIVDNSVETACVTFDTSSGKYLNFHFSQEFWKFLNTDNNRGFVISHECLHVIMGHGMRILAEKMPSYEEKSRINVALDLIINHTLEDYFGFQRTEELNGLCWIDTIFKNPETIDKNGTFEYYYDLLKNPENLDENYAKMADMANKTNAFLEKIEMEFVESLNEEMRKNVSFNDVENLNRKSNARNTGKPGDPLVEGKTNDIIISKPKINKKWSNLIKKFTKIEYEDCDVEQWSHKGRRHCNLDPKMMLPSEKEDIKLSSSRITVFFFLDASGSCWHLRKVFLNACKSLDPKRFDIRAFTRTTVVKEIDIKDKEVKWHGGGGSDNFACMERYIQSEIAKGKLSKYPDAVFHITDGGDCASEPFKKVQNPNVWHWFLTPGGRKYSIPDGCHIHQLKDYVAEGEEYY